MNLLKGEIWHSGWLGRVKGGFVPNHMHSSENSKAGKDASADFKRAR